MTIHKKSNRILKISLIATGCFILIVSILIGFFLMPWIKSKIISYVEEKTEYNLAINSIVFNGFNNVSVTGIELRPKLNVKEFYRIDNTERDWISVKTSDINIDDIDWKQLIKYKKVQARKITITDCDVYIYRDKKMKDPAYKYKPLPAQIIRDANFLATLPLIELRNGKIEYEENPEDGSAGKIKFSNLYGNLYNFSTDSVYMLKNPVVMLSGKGLIMDSIQGQMKYTFSSLSKDDNYLFEGKTGSFPASLLNKCITPLTYAKIQSGQVNHIQLSFHANNIRSTGSIKIDYHDLKIDILSKKDTTKKSIIKSFLAHTIIHKNNKKTNGEEEYGKINCERRRNKFIFAYWWDSIKSGILSEALIVDISQKNNKKHKNKN